MVAADVHLWAMDKYGERTAVQKKVLIIDDSPAQVKLMQSLLEKEGYWPVGLSDPKQVENTIAIERLNMIPVILVTSKDTASDKYWGQQQGADGYVTKPFTREELLRAVRRFA